MAVSGDEGYACIVKEKLEYLREWLKKAPYRGAAAYLFSEEGT